MKITREGKRFLFATILIAVAAVNTGNNLIYLIFSLMLSFVILAVALLQINLKRLSLEVSIDHPVFAGEETYAFFTIHNRKKLIPSYSFSVAAPGASSPVYCAYIGPKDSLKKEIKITFKKRGVYSYGDFFIQSGFPFILFEKSVKVKVSGEVLVYPALMNVEEVIPDIAGREARGSGRAFGSGNEIHSIREFRYGDDWRNIHWKASAKASSLMVKEYALTDIRQITVILDNLLPAGEEVFEKTLSLAGSLARHFLDAGYYVRVLSCKKVIPFGAGDEHFFKVLDILALMREEDALDCPVSHENEGFSILLLKSARSSFREYVSSADMVLYADSL
ncbi:MAG: DUF58 domain-containing protein [Nitrospirota bacterium]|nr:DUF58 domain-containing protein [Nitrospirota bacterium]